MREYYSQLDIGPGWTTLCGQSVRCLWVTGDWTYPGDYLILQETLGL